MAAATRATAHLHVDSNGVVTAPRALRAHARCACSILLLLTRNGARAYFARACAQRLLPLAHLVLRPRRSIGSIA